MSIMNTWVPPLPTSASTHNHARIWALVPCGGTGSRAGSGLPKQYRPLLHRPVLAHTLGALASVASIGGTVVVVAAADEYIQQPQPALPNHSWFGLFAHATHAPALAIAPCAGAQRAATVCNGLRWLLAHQASANDWVLVHDAARCLVLPQQIEQLIAACQTDAVGGLLAQPLADTLKVEHQGRSAHTPSRHDKWLAQTPQMFKIGMLLQALEATESQDFDGITDEASAIEQQGHAPLLVPSSAHNFKLTYPDDFMLASALLHERTRQHQP